MNFISSQPSNISGIAKVERLLDQAWGFINQQNVTQAKASCQKLNKEYPKNAEGWFTTSFLAFQLGDIQTALAAILKSVELEPENARWSLHQAHTLLISGKKVQAQTLTEELLKGSYTDVDFCAELALVLNKLSCFAEAELYYKKAIELLATSKTNNDSRLAQLYFNLASVQRYLGAIEAAEISLNKVIKLNNKDYEAHLLRSSLKTQSNDDNHIAELKQTLTQGIEHPLSKAQICYSLAKELEDIGAYKDSFHYLNEGARVRRKHMRYDIQHDLATINQIIETFDSSLFQNSTEGCDNDEAIFILGLPRTGSTLVERIVSNHEQAFSAGELNNFALSMMEQVKLEAIQAPKNKLELVALTSRLNFKKLGENYIQSTRPETGQTKRFIDKLPLNSLYVGLIHLALPNAKIVQVTRHPLDTCYAIFKQLFTNGYPFSYDLNELAQYYIAHTKLMDHWHKVMPGVIHDIAYEQLITDTETESRLLLDHCGLEWQSQCILFQNNKAASTTASATQVRQKIYQSSKGKWQHYRQELAPLKAQLEQAGICCD